MKNILIIEDDINIRESISDLLSLKNFKVSQASDGIEGVYRAKADTPDLILCDIMMPGLDGYEVLKELRLNKDTSNIPFIFLSAKSQKKEVREGMNLGADDYLPKPFKAVDLFNAVESRLNKYQLNQQELREKLEIMKPLKEASLEDKLIQPLQGIIDISNLINTYFDKYSKEDVEEMTATINKRASKLKRKIKNMILFQALKDLSSRPDLTKKISAIKPFNVRNQIMDQIRSIAADHHRERDLFIDLDNASINFSEEYFKIIVEELLQNAFQYSPDKSIIKIYSVSESNNFTFSIKNKISKQQERILTQVKDGKYGVAKSISKNQYGMGLELVKKLCEENGAASLFIKLNETGYVTIILKILNSIS